jgi:hypothetical protein
VENSSGYPVGLMYKTFITIFRFFHFHFQLFVTSCFLSVFFPLSHLHSFEARLDTLLFVSPET